MFSLILKDFLIQKKTLLFSFAYILILIYIFQGIEYVIFPVCIGAFTYILMSTACAHDDKNKADIMLNSLPLKRENIVLARYFSIYVFTLVGTVAYWLITNIIVMINLPVDVYPITISGFFGAIYAVTLINSIYFPVYFKVGYIKSRILNLIMFFALFFGLSNLIEFLKSNQSNPFIYKTMELFNGLSDVKMGLILSAILIAILLISFTLSIVFYRNREF